MADRHKFVLTKEIINNAETYIPLTVKTGLSRGISFFCVILDRYDGKHVEGGGGNDVSFPIPPRYEENIQAKSKYLMSVFLRYYLRFPYELEADVNEDALCVPDLLISDRDYDYFASSFIFNQAKRSKNSLTASDQDKLYDLLTDFKDFEKRLNLEINNVINRSNDTVYRLGRMAEKAVNPDWITDMTKEMQQMVATLEEQQAGIEDK